jgi:glycosyltransferase involved in cell wall biosynthesis
MAAWIAPTAFVAGWHASHGFPAERIHVVGHGIELPVTRGEVSRPQPEVADHFAYVGGLSPQKGVHVLIEAFNELPASARLTIAGDETAFPDYCAGLREQAAHSGIRFAGRLDRAGVGQALVEADALVVPSLWYETASLVVQEAFAVGTPVVAADHGALAERVRHEVNGLLVPPGDADALRGALVRLMEERGLITRLRGGIRPVMSMAEHVHKVEAIYRQVVGG